MKKSIPQNAFPKVKDRNKIVKNGHLNPADTKYPRWRFYKMNHKGEYSILNSNIENISRIIYTMSCLESQTWEKIKESTRGGSSAKSKSHLIDPNTAFTEIGRKLFTDNNLDEYADNIFSIEITNKERLFGILHDGVFDVLWYDPDHRIVKTKYNS